MSKGERLYSEAKVGGEVEGVYVATYDVFECDGDGGYIRRRRRMECYNNKISVGQCNGLCGLVVSSLSHSYIYPL